MEQSDNEGLTMKLNSKIQAALTERNFTPSVGAKARRSGERIMRLSIWCADDNK